MSLRDGLIFYAPLDINGIDKIHGKNATNNGNAIFNGKRVSLGGNAKLDWGSIGLSGNQPRTMAVSIKPNSSGVPSGWQGIFGFRGGSTKQRFDFNIGTANYGLVFGMIGTDFVIDYPVQTIWGRYLVTYDGIGTLKIYKNGFFKSVHSVSGLNTQDNGFYTGQRDDTGYYFNGETANGCVWNRVLSDKEALQDHLQNGNPLTPNKILSPFFYTTPPVPPTVTTGAVTHIQTNSGIGHGEITDDGGELLEKGICWNTTGTPTINDNKQASKNTEDEFEADIHHLITDTKYYVRAYATNSAGTSYGEEKEFTPTKTLLKLKQESGRGIKI